jgi:hypothetical protein
VAPPRYDAHSYYPTWHGGNLNPSRLVVELAAVGALAWSVYRRVTGVVGPTRLTRGPWIVRLVALAAVVALGALLLRLTSLDVVR